MSSPTVALILFIALLTGFFVGALVRKRQVERAMAEGKSKTAAEFLEHKGSLEAQLRLKAEEIERLRLEAVANTTDITTLRDALSRERIAKVAVEANLASAYEIERQRKENESLMADRFDALARRALSENTSSFLQTAKKSFEVEQTSAQGALQEKHNAFMDKLNPIQEKLSRLDVSITRLTEDEQKLASETRTLSNALRKAEVRGRWGELSLERVAELAGMVNRCDFMLQQTFSIDQQSRRPDMVVNLPLERYVVVDSKAVMDSYISACATEDPTSRAECLAQHSKHVRAKIDDLARTDYARILQKNGKNVADMVVCYLPGEAFFSAAIAQDPLLLEYAAKSRVFLASPTILITLLRAIALGWRDHELSENAEEIRTVGRELYNRLSTMKEHFDSLGTNLTKSVSSYNSLVSSLNSRVFPQARKFRDLGTVDVGAKVMVDGEHIERGVKEHGSPDWQIVLPMAASAESDS